jgi:hypothetical protein
MPIRYSISHLSRAQGLFRDAPVENKGDRAETEDIAVLKLPGRRRRAVAAAAYVPVNAAASGSEPLDEPSEGVRD